MAARALALLALACFVAVACAQNYTDGDAYSQYNYYDAQVQEYNQYGGKAYTKSYNKYPLSYDYYAKSCPVVEKVVADAVADWWNRAPYTAAALVRLVFHDCFVRGCDASILLDKYSNSSVEKANGANRGLGGFEVVDDIKKYLEAQCPKTVSCADVLVLAAREAVYLTGGPWIKVMLGRLDGLVSVASDANRLPMTADINSIIASFKSWNMGIVDIVALTGSHTIGISHCYSIVRALPPYKWTWNNPAYRAWLTRTCNAPKAIKYNKWIYNDQTTPNYWDNWYYKNILSGKSSLKVDGWLANDVRTRKWVQLYATNGKAWDKDFSLSFFKLTQIVYGTGEVRCQCNKQNSA